MERATIRKVMGGYIVEVRWPYGGSPMGSGEVVCTTFDHAVSELHRHLHTEGCDVLKAGEKLIVRRSGDD